MIYWNILPYNEIQNKKHFFKKNILQQRRMLVDIKITNSFSFKSYVLNLVISAHPQTPFHLNHLQSFVSFY